MSEEGTDHEKNTVKAKLDCLLNTSNLQKFMYSLHIVENLATKGSKMFVRSKTIKKIEYDQSKATDITAEENEEDDKEIIQHEIASSSSSMSTGAEWSTVFIKVGGVKHLYEIFLSGVLQSSSHPDDKYNEWRHDCLGCVLRIIFMLGEFTDCIFFRYRH